MPGRVARACGLAVGGDGHNRLAMEVAVLASGRSRRPTGAAFDVTGAERVR